MVQLWYNLEHLCYHRFNSLMSGIVIATLIWAGPTCHDFILFTLLFIQSPLLMPHSLAYLIFHLIMTCISTHSFHSSPIILSIITPSRQRHKKDLFATNEVSRPNLGSPPLQSPHHPNPPNPPLAPRGSLEQPTAIPRERYWNGLFIHHILLNSTRPHHW